MAALQAKLSEKVRAEIGELLPDDLVREMVQQEARAFFLEPTTERTVDSWGKETKHTKPSAFQAVVRELALPMIEQAVKDATAERAGVIDRQIRAMVATDQVPIMVSAAVAAVTRQTLAGLAGEIVQELRNVGVIRGY